MSYLITSGVSLKEKINATLKLLEGKSFNAIAVRGASGLLVGSAVAATLGKQIIIVRKETDNHHSGNAIEGLFTGSPKITYVIIDDFVDTGDTLKTIHNVLYRQVQEWRTEWSNAYNITCVGVVLYDRLQMGFLPIEKHFSSSEWEENIQSLEQTPQNEDDKKEERMKRAGAAIGAALRKIKGGGGSMT